MRLVSALTAAGIAFRYTTGSGIHAEDHVTTTHRKDAALADNIIALYESHAREWAAARRGGQGMEQAWLDRFASLLPKGATVLDIGCGSGEPMAEYFIARGFELTGVDSSPTMLSLCRERFPEHVWLEADMRSLALGRVFDGLLAWDSFFHLKHDDQRRMFAVFAAHSATNSVLMFTSGPAHGEAIGTMGGEALYHASLDSHEYRELLASHDFSVVAQVIDDPSCGGHTVWLARRN